MLEEYVYDPNVKCLFLISEIFMVDYIWLHHIYDDKGEYNRIENEHFWVQKEGFKQGWDQQWVGNIYLHDTASQGFNNLCGPRHVSRNAMSLFKNLTIYFPHSS